MKASVSTAPEFSSLTPELMFEGSFYETEGRQYDAFAGEEDFLMIEAVNTAQGVASFRVVTNWFAELERLVSTK